jgi:hypothetical protein
MVDLDKVRAMIETAYLYIPYDSEALRINYTDPEVGMFYTTGEESGDEIAVSFDEVDLERDMFYRLKLMDLNDIE